MNERNKILLVIKLIINNLSEVTFADNKEYEQMNGKHIEVHYI